MVIEKVVKRLLGIVLVLVCVTGFCLRVFAIHTGFTTEEVDAERQQKILSNLELHQIPQPSTLVPGPIHCFDVNADGWIVIGSESLDDKFVLVYAPDGTFQYGYTFTDYGTFDVGWNNSNVLIYFVRGDLALELDPQGECVDLRKIQNTWENNDYWNETVRATKREVQGYQYRMRNASGILNLFMWDYAQLIRMDANGNTTVLYDASNEYEVRTVMFLVIGVAFVMAVVLGLVRYLKEVSKHAKRS